MDQWDGIYSFFVMGGYGRYVWGAYGMVVLCFLCELYILVRRRRLAIKELQLQARAHQAEEDL
ncbi:MAG: heme exporter protein CcmD [Burkholderiales bacterium]|nr:heme exporter protein CcmD [Burkholderiales bacterium]